MESNLTINKPKLNVTNIKSPLAGTGNVLGNVGQGGTSNAGTLARIVRKNRISINSLVKSQETQDRKITIIKNIIQNQQQNIGKKLPTGDKQTQDKNISIIKNIQSVEKQNIDRSDKGNIEKSLAETNQILVQIQQELMRASTLRSKEERAKLDRAKRGSSRAKLSAEESQLEKSSKKIKNSVGEKAEEAVAPVKGIFERIMDFVKTIALGIAANAIFEWLKNPENMEKVKGWFSWIKDNWGWALAAVGAIALLPLIGAIGGLIGSLGIMMPLFGAAVPFLAKALLIAGAAVLAWKGLEAGFNAIRNQVTGGSEFSAAHDILDKQLEDAGLDKDGKRRGEGAAWDFLGWAGTRKEEEMTDEQKKISKDVLAKRKELNSLRDQMRGEIQKKNLEIDEQAGLTMSSSDSALQATQSTRNTAEKEIRAKYAEKIAQIVPLGIEMREKGGPVKAGRPYLVGERGPELIVPDINGTVINNQKTERIYQTISSRRKGRGGINMVNLPPITNKLPPPELPSMEGQATDVPDIASANPADRYRQLSSSIYGIMV